MKIKHYISFPEIIRALIIFAAFWTSIYFINYFFIDGNPAAIVVFLTFLSFTALCTYLYRISRGKYIDKKEILKNWINTKAKITEIKKIDISSAPKWTEQFYLIKYEDNKWNTFWNTATEEIKYLEKWISFDIKYNKEDPKKYIIFFNEWIEKLKDNLKK